jgi:hypothetical protein
MTDQLTGGTEQWRDWLRRWDRQQQVYIEERERCFDVLLEFAERHPRPHAARRPRPTWTARSQRTRSGSYGRRCLVPETQHPPPLPVQVSAVVDDRRRHGLDGSHGRRALTCSGSGPPGSISTTASSKPASA